MSTSFGFSLCSEGQCSGGWRCGGGEGLEGENLHTVQNSPLKPSVHTVDFCCLGVGSKPLIGADCHRSQHHETAENLS